MAVKHLITQGLGVGGPAGYLLTRGLGAYGATPGPPTDYTMTVGALDYALTLEDIGSVRTYVLPLQVTQYRLALKRIALIGPDGPDPEVGGWDDVGGRSLRRRKRGSIVD